MAAATASGAKDIPPVPAGTDAQLATMLQRMREEIQRLDGFLGNHLDMAVTWRQLQAQGLVSLSDLAPRGGQPPGSVSIGDGSVVYTPDLTPPPDVTGLAAAPGLTSVVVTTDAPTYTQGHGSGSTRIYAAKGAPGDPPHVFGDATIAVEGFGSPTVLSISSEPNTRWSIWAKWKSADGVESVNPAGGTNGVVVTTGQDVTSLLNALTQAAINGGPYSEFAVRADLFYVGDAAGSYAGIPFFVTTTPITQNGVTCPPGVYITDAFIANGTITNAMIGNAVIDDAKITDLSASKLTVGDGTVGGNLKSTNYVAGSAGWILQPSGAAQLPAASVIGLLTGSQIDAATITGTNIAATTITTTNLVVGSATSSSNANLVVASDPLPNVSLSYYTRSDNVLSFTSTGRPVEVVCNAALFFAELDPSVDAIQVFVNVYVDGVDLGIAGDASIGSALVRVPAQGGVGVTLGVHGISTPTAGSHTYEVLIAATPYDASGSQINFGASAYVAIHDYVFVRENKV